MFRIVWEFVAREGQVAEYEEAYGPEGVWARFFRQGRGYRRTELEMVAGAERTYRTNDVWDTKEDFERFKHDFAAEYAAIDARCEDLTENETFIGHFESKESDV